MLTQKQKNELWDQYKKLGAKALKSSHYTLAIETNIDDPTLWKEFLMEPDVNDYIIQETNLLQQAEFRNILLNSDKDSSAGRAQLINALNSVTQKSKKDGNIIIYSYVPLNAQQLKAPNIEINKEDIFKTDKGE